MFVTQTGRPLSRNHVHETFKRLVTRAGLPESTRIHDLRHAMATLWLSQGEPVKVVSERLGHSRGSTTMDIYAHALPGLQAEAADRMDAWFTDLLPTDPSEPEK